MKNRWKKPTRDGLRFEKISRDKLIEIFPHVMNLMSREFHLNIVSESKFIFGNPKVSPSGGVEIEAEGEVYISEVGLIEVVFFLNCWHESAFRAGQILTDYEQNIQFINLIPRYKNFSEEQAIENYCVDLLSSIKEKGKEI